jgi:hypothetical protein
MLSSHETSPKSGLSQLTSIRQHAEEAFKILNTGEGPHRIQMAVAALKVCFQQISACTPMGCLIPAIRELFKGKPQAVDINKVLDEYNTWSEATTTVQNGKIVSHGGPGLNFIELPTEDDAITVVTSYSGPGISNNIFSKAPEELESDDKMAGCHFQKNFVLFLKKIAETTAKPTDPKHLKQVTSALIIFQALADTSFAGPVIVGMDTALVTLLAASYPWFRDQCAVIIREGQERKANGIGTKLLAQFNHVAKEESRKWDGCGLRSTAALIFDQLDVKKDDPQGVRLEKFRRGHRWLMEVIPGAQRVLVDWNIDLGKFADFSSTGTTTKEDYLRLCGGLDEKFTEIAKDRELVLSRADSLMAVAYDINEDVIVFDNFSSADRRATFARLRVKGSSIAFESLDGIAQLFPGRYVKVRQRGVMAMGAYGAKERHQQKSDRYEPQRFEHSEPQRFERSKRNERSEPQRFERSEEYDRYEPHGFERIEEDERYELSQEPPAALAFEEVYRRPQTRVDFSKASDFDLLKHILMPKHQYQDWARGGFSRIPPPASHVNHMNTKDHGKNRPEEPLTHQMKIDILEEWQRRWNALANTSNGYDKERHYKPNTASGYDERRYKLRSTTPEPREEATEKKQKWESNQERDHKLIAALQMKVATATAEHALIEKRYIKLKEEYNKRKGPVDVVAISSVAQEHASTST